VPAIPASASFPPATQLKKTANTIAAMLVLLGIPKAVVAVTQAALVTIKQGKICKGAAFG
jgi:hypothetical protein